MLKPNVIAHFRMREVRGCASLCCALLPGLAGADATRLLFHGLLGCILLTMSLLRGSPVQSDNGFELLDSSPVAGQHFPTIPVLVAQLRDVALSDKLKVGLQDCIPYASEA